MLSYQHIYHAGNFADTQKHVLLAKTVAALKNKAPALFVLDTHAGRGLYDLNADEAQKTQEYQNGAPHLWQSNDPAVQPWADIVRKYNDGDTLDVYPGSARIAKDIAGDAGRAILCELHPGEYAELEKTFTDARNVQVINKDGLTVLAERLPPQERAGIVIIDPSYELKTDYTAIPRALRSAVKKWPKGVFFVWYPILKGEPHRAMLTALRKSDVRNVLVSEIRLKQTPEQGFAMFGTGIAIINPPLPQAAYEASTQYVAAALPGEAAADVFFLDNKAINPETGEI